MIAYIGILVFAALLIGFWVWMRALQHQYLRDLAQEVRYDVDHADPWERPRIVKVNGGVYDVAENGDLG